MIRNLPALATRRAVALGLSLSQHSGFSIEHQIAGQLREMIVSGALGPGVKLPSSRMLADELGCSRTPVVAAFDRLLAEGYLHSRPRSALHVADDVDFSQRAAARKVQPPTSRPSQRGMQLVAAHDRWGQRIGGMPGHPAIEGFPFELWGRLCARVWRHPTSNLIWSDDPAGYLPLREAIALHLRLVRGLMCTAEQVVITSGTRHGADLTARILLDAGDAVAVEDPGWPAWQLLASHGQLIQPVPVDREGIMVDALAQLHPVPRMVCVTPSHQYPLGSAMSLQRRFKLLDWARATGRWVLEDDFDSEFRYTGSPVSALKSLDEERVVYLGTFSKSMFPTLRLGYIVLPMHLVDAFLRARATIDGFPPVMMQPVMAAFLSEGHLARHVRNMRQLYKARHDAFTAAINRHLGRAFEIVPAELGLSLTVLCRNVRDDVKLANQARACGLPAFPLSSAHVATPPVPGLLLGLAAVPEEQADAAFARLAALMSDTAPAR
jgi:GntR family transcriptional regulator/MocR family aminotransferase